MDDRIIIKQSIITPELYFLISKLLSVGPLKETAKIFINELEQHKVLPKRIDWEGQEHDQTFAELERKYPHIGPQHLIDICCRVGPILDREIVPSVPGILSLLGAGRQSLLRTKESISRPKCLLDYCTRLNGKPLANSSNRHKNKNNLIRVLYGRETSGPITRRQAIPPTFYEKQTLLRRTLGHLSAVYCVLFDRTGKYIITGADDLLVKLWSAIDGRLLATFRGASAEITDIAINIDNSLLAAGSLDRILRVWDLQTTGPIAVLTGHTGMITSVNFCPSPRGDLRYLVTTSTDGSVAFWQYTTQRGGKTGFASKPIQYHEKLRPGQAQMICASFSPGGIFLAAGSADHYVRVYIMSEDGPKRILETESHSDTVDSIQWAHNGLRFISGSKDGTAHVWHFESQQWKSIKLNMSDRLGSCPEPEDESKKLKVTMVSWDYSDKWVITAVNDFTIKVWNPLTGELCRVLRGHTDELYVLESHPKDSQVLLSAGHDGQLFIWDIVEGISIANFINHIEGQGQGGVFDAKWSPDGTMIAATDSHGHILVFGFGTGHERLKILPKELFFHTDYRPLIRDSNHFVLDEQTQTLPHLMPPPFLVDVDGNPHPPLLQRLVPGRENCPSDQLIPNIAVGVGVEGVELVEEGVRSDLDRLIEALANRQGQEQAPDSNNDRENMVYNRYMNNSPRGIHNIALRRTGDVEGVRQSSGNWQRDGSFKWIRRIYVQHMRYSQLQAIKQCVYTSGLQEMEFYRREIRRRPLMINTLMNSISSMGPPGTNRRRGRIPKRGGIPPAYRTRAVREREHIEEEEDDEEEPEVESASASGGESSDSTAAEEDLLFSGSSSSETESSEYSDWIADQPGVNLEPPKRSKRKPVQRRVYSPGSDNNSPTNNTTTKKNPKGRKIPIPTENGEIPESYRPPEWLSEVIPRKAPYYPQMGDEVVYLRQGHQQYLEAVRLKKVYKLSNNSEPWTYIELREHELCKVIGIKYEIRPPRLCCLKLGLMERDGHLTGDSFTIKYHDMPDVLDFLVLRQTFDTAVTRNWCPDDRFRCMIDDGWWMGQIQSRTALNSSFPNSNFMCFRVRWDNGEYEYMSPWDMEPIDENRLPDEVGGAVPVLPEELRATLYQPKTEEWPRGDREATCRRIINGLEQVMGLAIADPFLAPVDLNIYPGYAFVVEYPIDLSTIKARFENHFYRRITSAQFDVRYLATNAEKFNQPHSNIVKHARIITDLCLRIIRDPNGVDVGAVYHQLVDTYLSSDSDNENQPGPSTSTSTTDRRQRSTGSRRSKRLQSVGDWRVDCRELLEMIWQCEDSTPFREPVDLIEHPDYNQAIDTPMDLMTVKEDLLGGNYTSPLEFSKDMKLIFLNSRNYNTNKRSRIYTMTLRLSTLFEAYIKPIICNWKSMRRRKADKKSPTTTDVNKPGTSKMVTRATTNGAGPSRQHYSEYSDDDDDDAGGNGGVAISASANNNNDRNNVRTRNKRLPPTKRSNHASGSNTVSSSINTDAVPGPSRGGRRPGLRTNSQENHRSESDLSSSSNSSDSDSDSDMSGIPLAALGDGIKQKALAKVRTRNYSSEDSYKPNRKETTLIKKRPGRPGRPKKHSSTKKKHKDDNSQDTPKKRGRKRPHRIRSDDDDDGGGNENEKQGRFSEIDRTPKKRQRNNGVNDANDHFTRSRQTSSHSDDDDNNGNHNSSSNNDDDDDDDNSKGHKRRGKKNKRYESDHSYHLDVPQTRKAVVVESDSETENPRPTRGSLRRAQMAWGREEDSLEEDDTTQTSTKNDNNHETSHRRRRGRRKRINSDNSGDGDNRRFLKKKRNRMPDDVDQEDEEEAEEQQEQDVDVNIENDDEEQISDQEYQPSSSRTRSNRIHKSQNQLLTNGGGSTSSLSVVVTQFSRRPHRHTSMMTRNLTQTSIVDSSQGGNRHRGNINDDDDNSSSLLHPHQVDHNYGEPGPSTIRQRRRILSRHQRNPDELDNNDETISIVLPQSSTSSRLRLRNNLNNSNNSSNSNSNSPPKRTYNTSTTRRQNHYFVADNNNVRRRPIINDNDEDDDDDDGDDNDHLNSDDNDSDPDDNTPLQMMVTSSRNNRLHNTRSGGVTRRHYFSDDDPDAGPSSVRNTRNLKRPQYNEDSGGDDEQHQSIGNHYRKRSSGGGVSGDTQSSSNSPNHHYQNNNNRHHQSTILHNNRNNNNNNNQLLDEQQQSQTSDNEQPVSISSRGRVRKLTAKARGLFRD